MPDPAASPPPGPKRYTLAGQELTGKTLGILGVIAFFVLCCGGLGTLGALVPQQTPKNIVDTAGTTSTTVATSTTSTTLESTTTGPPTTLPPETTTTAPPPAPTTLPEPPTTGAPPAPAPAPRPAPAPPPPKPAPAPAPAPAPPPAGHPAGTTGRCNDGTYTSAAHSQGACSHHNGLAEYWG